MLAVVWSITQKLSLSGYGAYAVSCEWVMGGVWIIECVVHEPDPVAYTNWLIGYCIRDF